MISRILALALAVLVLFAAPARATAGTTEEQAKAAARHLLIALRVLSYDKQLADRSSGAVTIVLVSSPTPEGRALRNRFADGFALMPKVKVGGRAVRVVGLDAGAEKRFSTALAGTGASAVFVVDDLGKEFATVKATTRAHGVLSISMSEADVTRGFSVAIVQTKERDQIVINIEASRAERVRFGAGLLQLARLVEETH